MQLPATLISRETLGGWGGRCGEGFQNSDTQLNPWIAFQEFPLEECNHGMVKGCPSQRQRDLVIFAWAHL